MNNHLRELGSVPYREERCTPEFHDFATRAVLPSLRLAGYKRAAKAALAVSLLQNLVCAGQKCKTVADTRDTHAPDVRLRAGVWDAIVAAGWAQCCRGSEVSHRVTRYYATEMLHRVFEAWHLPMILDLQLDRGSEKPAAHDTALVVFRRGKRCHVTGQRLSKAQQRERLVLPPQAIPDNLSQMLTARVRQTEDELDFINRQNLRHRWEGYVTDPATGETRVFQPDVCLQQQHSGWPCRAVRLYTPGRWGAQNLRRDVRRQLRIDGEATVELDYAACHLRIAYNDAGHDAGPGDAYRAPDVLPAYYRLPEASSPAHAAIARELVKRATCMALNNPSVARAARALTTWVHKHPDRQYMLWVIHRYEGTSPQALIERIASVHDTIGHRFFKNVGTSLMTLESKIMLRVCLRFAMDGPVLSTTPMTAAEQLAKFGRLEPGACRGDVQGRPVLPIHDAVCCRASDADFAMAAMQDVYCQTLGFLPVVTRKD